MKKIILTFVFLGAQNAFAMQRMLATTLRRSPIYTIKNQNFFKRHYYFDQFKEEPNWKALGGYAMEACLNTERILFHLKRVLEKQDQQLQKIEQLEKQVIELQENQKMGKEFEAFKATKKFESML